MQMTVFTFLALAAMVIIYAWLGQGGAVSGLIFFGILLIGVIVKVARRGRASDVLRSSCPPPPRRRPRLGPRRDDLEVFRFEHQGALAGRVRSPPGRPSGRRQRRLAGRADGLVGG